jgi:2-oxo-4-hydroxy-4-carboxy-5-ureidoimidazoline decarboxylase
MGYRIEDINQCDEACFIELLGGIFEHSPWIAELVYDQRPFASRDRLHEVMVTAVRQAPQFQRMALLCSHPELAGREARDGDLTRASRREQAGAGLDRCSAEELEKIEFLNRAYRDKFEFPFIIAVAGLDKQQIIAAMENRLANDPETEFESALDEIEKIARIRIDALIDE